MPKVEMESKESFKYLKRVFVVLSLMLFSLDTMGQDVKSHPKLILQITVDQLRGDMPRSVYERLGEDGFRYFYEQGIVYENAQHGHANTETVVGHATLATGAYPADHGMVGNIWYDKELKRLVYNIEDSRYTLTGKGGDVDKSTEVDGTQKVALSDGRSPSNMLVTSFSDELAMSTWGKSKVFGVSVKDRGAVTLAGHAGKAFWFSKSSGEFISSTYYYDEYPKWVEAWNNQKHATKYAGTSWELLYDKSTYTQGEFDDMPYEIEMPVFGIVFPHAFGEADFPYFNTFITFSPAGDELTLDFAKALLVNEEVGKDEITDFLSISFSATDYIGHVFGPNSLESEDNLLRLDRTLAELITFVDKEVGLENTLLVLSADHGAAAVPAQLNEFGIAAEYIELDSVNKAVAIENIRERFGISQEIIMGYFHPYIYLDKKVIGENGLDLDEVSRAVAEEMVTFHGIAYAIPSVDLLEGRIADTRLNAQVLRNFNAKRSGDIYVVWEPHSFPGDDGHGSFTASTHGSPWRYDTFVPLIFAGHGLQPKTIYREVKTVDIALTLSKYLKIKGPSGATGNPLTEVLEQ